MNEKLNIQNLIDLFVQKQGISPKEAEEFVKAFFSLIEEGLEQDRYVKIRKWGTFKLIDVDSRESVDVNTGERIEIQGHTKVSFTPDSSLKEIINRPFAHFETVILNENTVLEDTPLEDESEKESDAETDVPIQEKPQAGEEKIEEPISEATTEVQSGIDEKSDRPEPTDKIEEEEPFPSPKDNSMKYFITLAVLIIAICGGAIFFIYNPDFFARPLPPPEEPTHITENLESLVPSVDSLSFDVDSFLTDSIHTDIVLEDVNTLAIKPEVTEPVEEKVEAPVLVPKKERKQTAAGAFITDSTSYEIVGTEKNHTIAEGETLTRVALKYYGTKALWPYLVKHNPDVIKNPDNVPSGTVIKIPKLRKKI